MVIRELTSQASRDLLGRVHLGRLACSRANQPYVFPLFFAHYEDSLYCVSTVGKKIEWMRENPLVAIEVDEIHSAQEWTSVIVSGRYEEFSNAPDTRDMREMAWSLLQNANPLWWEPAYVQTILDGAERPIAPLYFRIRIGNISGRRATKE